MRYSEAIGRHVVSTASAATIGVVQNVLIEPANQRVVALALGRTTGAHRMLPWERIAAFGADAVTVGADDVLVTDGRLNVLDGKDHAILGKQVLTTQGYRVGSVTDVEFDPADGVLGSLLLDTYQWDARLLLGVGSYAVIVRPQQIHPPEGLATPPQLR